MRDDQIAELCARQASTDVLHRYCRAVDRFEYRDGEWRTARRVVGMDWYVTETRGPASPHLDAFTRGRRDRDDAIYTP